ncbi:MAG: glycoside hydrolase family 127 protein [Treponema sp.]|jgi:DUF1680 family protein|nr:glycoside hydrolase family 127 protein [Treponema sp.]
MQRTSYPAQISQITIADSFWSRYVELIRARVLPYQWEALNDRIPGAEPSYCIHNFKVAAGRQKGVHGGWVFQDSDLAKWIEAAAYVLMQGPDAELEKNLDEVIDLICSAQQSDGYLNTYYIINGLDKRWTNLRDNHELYCLGHLIEAAAAYFKASGKDKFLKAVIRYVDLVDNTFGPEPHKLHGYPGHELIEMALAGLYDLTGDKKHLALAKYFIDERGKAPLYFKEEAEKNGNPSSWERGPHGFHYYQAALPVREQRDARGHAVRAVYLYSGMADLGRLSGDEELIAACEKLWQSITQKQMYITGSIGSTAHGEAFSFDYDLPNDTVYGETCAAIGLVFFARRMLQLTPDSQYSDVMERALYNGVISGMSLDGESFFYVNPLEVIPEASEKDFYKAHVKPERQKWFGCACCPPNLARLLASLGSYAYTLGDGGELFMHLYLGGRFSHTVNKQPVDILVDTNYPWEGGVTITVNPQSPVPFAYTLRIPGWCSQYTLQVNGQAVNRAPDRGYVRISRTWKAGDTISLNMDMPVTVNMAHPMLRDNIGMVAVSRGPLVYCIEEADNGPNLHLYSLGEYPDFQVQFKKEILGGIRIITSDSLLTDYDNWQQEGLYRKAAPELHKKRRLIWIPYYAWANRGKGEMRVWIHK